jgi:predicted GH43/DUF377 family glycosyl hydrolase
MVLFGGWFAHQRNGSTKNGDTLMAAMSEDEEINGVESPRVMKTSSTFHSLYCLFLFFSLL